MMKLRTFLYSALVLSLSLPVAANTLNIGTGSTKGNYFQIGQDIKSFCSSDVSVGLNVVESGGSVANLMGLQNKEFSLAIVQEDVLNYHAKRNPKQVNKNCVKALIGLHEESVHLLIPKGYTPKSDDDKSMWSSFFGKDDQQPKKFSLGMLKGQTVGSWGGSMVSAEALGYFFGLNLNVVEVKRDVNDTSKPLVLVGGAPYAVVQEYLASGKWTMAPLDYNAISQQASFYSKQSVNYQISGKVRSIPTVSVRALLIGKSFRKESRNEPMAELATCIYGNLGDLADDPGTNPNWASVYDYVESEGQSDWAYFPLNEEKLAEYEASN